MKASEHTLEQIKNVISQALGAFPHSDEALPMTDILIQANQDSGELVVSDDENNELARAVIEEFAGNEDEYFYNGILADLRRAVGDMHAQLLDAGIMKPYDILLVNDEGETVANLYCVEEDTVVLDNEMIRKIDDDLDNFLKKLMEE